MDHPKRHRALHILLCYISMCKEKVAVILDDIGCQVVVLLLLCHPKYIFIKTIANLNGFLVHITVA